MNIDAIKKRKGAKKAGEIPIEVLTLLNNGCIETVNRPFSTYKNNFSCFSY